MAVSICIEWIGIVILEVEIVGRAWVVIRFEILVIVLQAIINDGNQHTCRKAAERLRWTFGSFGS